jgi:hypothetical protein
VSSAAAALALGEDDPSMRGRLNLLTLVALAVEAGALACERRALDRTGVKTAERSAWGLVDLVLVRGLGLIAPVALLAAAVGASVSGRRSDRTAAALSTAASLGVLAGSFFLRAARLGLGGESARRPEISLSFAQPEHLPEAYAGPRGRTQGL